MSEISMCPYGLFGFHTNKAGTRGIVRSMRFALVALASLITALFATLSIRADARSKMISVLVELEQPPLTQVYAANLAAGVQSASITASTQAQLAVVDAAQQALLPGLAALGAEVIYRNQRVYNAIALRIDAAALGTLAQLPGVQRIHRLIPKAPLNSRSVPLIAAPALWQGANGAKLTGEGVTIAIIDTGIDYLHTAFGGPGVGYDENDLTRIGDVTGFPNAKIIGGYDFTGDEYDAYNYPFLAPDPDPMDCYPHGTGVAATAAGYGVNADGVTYAGPYHDHLDYTAFRIGPGVAPHAQIYALKVFGCGGASEVVDQAIEWAVDPNGDGDLSDRVDVINLSLGSRYGAVDDMTTVAAENAASAGVIVVAAAGNSGDNIYVVNSPSVGNQTISVAAGDEGPAYADMAGFSARGPRRYDSALKPDILAPGVSIVTAYAGTGDGRRAASGTSLATPQVAGAFALLRQRYPGWTPAELKALAMNTAVTSLYANGGQPGSALYGPQRLGAGRISLTRAVAASALVYEASGLGLVSLSFGAPEVLGATTATKEVRIANRTTQPATYTLTYVGFTDAPGVDIQLPVTTVVAAGNGYATIPVHMIAEASAIHRTRDATLSPTQAGEPRHWLSEESGYLLVWPATPFTVMARADGASTGQPAGQDNAQVRLHYGATTRQLSVTVTTTPPVTVTAVAITAMGGRSDGTTYQLYNNPLGSPPGEPITGSVTLRPGDELALAYDQLRILITTGAEPAETLSATISRSPPVLNLPIYAAPRPAAAMRAISVTLDFGAAITGTDNIRLAGAALTGGQPPTDVVSLVSLVELQASSPRLGREAGDRADEGAADLQYSGVTSNFATTVSPTWPAGSLPDTTIYFAVTTYENWATPNEVTFEIPIDTDGDGEDDYLLFSSDAIGYATGRSASDRFVAALRNLTTGVTTVQGPLNGLSPDAYDTSLFNSRVLLLPVRASELGLSAQRNGFWYRIESFSSDLPLDESGARRRVDQMPHRYFDPTQPGLRFSGEDQQAAVFFDRDDTLIGVAFDAPAFLAAHSQGILLLHHHNLSEWRAEVIAVRTAWQARVYLPLVRRS
jgi:subtilisin family serine protease